MIVFLERTSGVVKQEVHERPGGNLIGVRMAGVVIWYVHESPALSKSRVNECPCERISLHLPGDMYSVLKHVRLQWVGSD